MMMLRLPALLIPGLRIEGLEPKQGDLKLTKKLIKMIPGY